MQAPELTSEALKALIQQNSATLPTRVVAFLAAAALFVAVFEAVRRRRLHENLTPIWITTAVSILVLSVWFDLLLWLTNAIGAWTPSSTVFFLGLMFLTAISLSYAVRLSSLSDQVKTLAQELAIVKADATATVTNDDGGDTGPQ
tara:strand:- start:21 stop:455 length:435 start_codon:yes stop_codon:yes gene_type:complete